MSNRDDHPSFDPPVAADDEQPVVAPPRGYERRQRQAFKDALMVAFHRLGGVEFLVRFGQDNPGEFARLCAKLIPQEVRMQQGGEVVIRHVLPPPHVAGVDLNDTDRFIPFERARQLGYIDAEDYAEDARPVRRDDDLDPPP